MSLSFGKLTQLKAEIEETSTDMGRKVAGDERHVMKTLKKYSMSNYPIQPEKSGKHKMSQNMAKDDKSRSQNMAKDDKSSQHKIYQHLVGFHSSTIMFFGKGFQKL